MPDFPPFTFVCGDDDYLVEREARARFEAMCAGVADDMSREVLDAGCTKAADVEEVLARFRAATQTMSLFGDRKFVWVKNFNWVADSVMGRGESTKALVAGFIDTVKGLDPAGVCVLVSAYPLDGRRREAKALKDLGETVELKSPKDAGALAAQMQRTARGLGVTLTDDAAMTLVEKVNRSLRMAETEVGKLACYVGEGGVIEAETVVAMVPTFGEGDFFEPVEAFFSGDLAYTLESLRRYFYQNDEARPLIASLLSRIRLLIQLRTLADAGAIRITARGLNESEMKAAQRTYAHHFPDDAAKAKYNVFAANVWYLGKMAPAAQKFTLRKLVDMRLALDDAFGAILDRPNDQETVMREFAVRCLS